MHRALIVVGKAPVAGSAKTRLVPPLSAEAAAALYRGFLLDTLDLALSLGWEQTTIVHPRGQARDLGSLLGHLPRVRLLEQPRDGLGQALAHAFEAHFAAGFEHVILIGSDNPTLPPAPVLAAQTALEDGNDLVIGPSVDGGYYLIGMRQPHLGVFEHIDWSTPRVFEQTLTRARALDLRVHAVEAWYDVDEPADLDHLRADLRATPRHIAANTRRALANIAHAQRDQGAQDGGTRIAGVSPERRAYSDATRPATAEPAP